MLNVVGNNPLFWFLTRVIEQKGELPMLPRFRDVWTREVDGKAQIIIYTRTGGNNRCASETVAMAEHPLYIETWDDAFDNTYAHFAFNVPARLNERMITFHRLFSRHPKGMEPKKKFDLGLEILGNKAPVEIDFPPEHLNEVVDLCKDMQTDMRDGPSSIERHLMHNMSFSAPHQ